MTAQVDILQPSLYSLRHGGASADALNGIRSMNDIRLRGRWASDRSLLCYCKESRANAELLKLREEVRSLAVHAEQLIDDMFHKPCVARDLLSQLTLPADASAPLKGSASKRSRTS